MGTTVVGIASGSRPRLISTFDMPRNNPTPMASSAISAAEKRRSSSVRSDVDSGLGKPINTSVRCKAATSRGDRTAS